MFGNFYLESPTNIDNILYFEQKYKFNLPKDYKDFLLHSNGGEGEIGENGYLRLFPIEELIEVNNDYSIFEYLNNILVFGSDGGGIGYAFDVSNDSIVEVDFNSLNENDIFPLSENFDSFIEYLFNLK